MGEEGFSLGFFVLFFFFVFFYHARSKTATGASSLEGGSVGLYGLVPPPAPPFGEGEEL